MVVIPVVVVNELPLAETRAVRADVVMADELAPLVPVDLFIVSHLLLTSNLDTTLT